MTKKCVVKNCKREKRDTFHRNSHKHWMDLLDIRYTVNGRVCSKHFKPSDYQVKGDGNIWLKKYAYPIQVENEFPELVNEIEIDEDVSMDDDAANIAEHGEILLVARQRKMSTATTIILFVAAVTVLFMGIMGGIAIYRSCARARLHRFHGFCGVPYDSTAINNNAMLYMNSQFRDDSGEPAVMPLADAFADINQNTLNDLFFKEEFELGLGDDESFSKIDIPNFRDGRTGRYYHDFRFNQSAIIDAEAGRCFIMPLDRSTVQPPQNFFDLIMKMQQGEYNIDTTVVKKNMRVVLPAVSDMSSISSGIAEECDDKKIYMLEKFVSGVFKRSVSTLPNSGKFAEFVGKHIVEYNLGNMEAVENYEKN